MILAAISWSAPQEKRRQHHDRNKGIHENVILPKVSKECQIFNLRSKDLLDCRKTSVVGEGVRTELNHWQRAEQD